MSEPTLDILSVDCGGLRADLITCRQDTAQGERVLVRHPESGKTFLLSDGAFRVLLSLKSGQPARESIAAAFAGGIEKTPAIANLVAHAHAASLLTGGEAAAATTEPVGLVARAAGWNPLYVRLPILDPQPAVRLLRPFAGFLFHRWMSACWLLAMAATAVALQVAWSAYGREFQIFRDFAWWPAVYATLALSAILHETAHVMMCDRFGVAVKQVGLLFYFFQPGAYADVSGAWMLPQRYKRVAIALAGVYVESMVWILATACWLIVPAGALHQIAFVAGVCLSTRIVLNLIPFLRLDGYWVLSDFIGMPNLRSSAFAYLAAMTGLGSRTRLAARTTRKQAIVLLCYGSAAVVFGVLALAVAYHNLCRWVTAAWPGSSSMLSWCLAIVAFTFVSLNVWVRVARNRS
jgi:hypothetical protein